MLLITIFVELRVVAGRSRTRAGSPQAVSRRPFCAVALRRTAWSERAMGAAWPWHCKCESDTAALCKSNGKGTFQTLSGPAWQGNGIGAAWARHAMCEEALKQPSLVMLSELLSIWCCQRHHLVPSKLTYQICATT